MMTFHADIPTSPEQCLREYVESLVSLLASLNPKILPDDGVTIRLWKHHAGMCFNLQYVVGFNFFLLV